MPSAPSFSPLSDASAFGMLLATVWLAILFAVMLRRSHVVGQGLAWFRGASVGLRAAVATLLLALVLYGGEKGDGGLRRPPPVTAGNASSGSNDPGRSPSLAAPRTARPTTLSDLSAFDDWVAASRSYDSLSGVLFPPGSEPIGKDLGIVPFDASALPFLLAAPDEPLLGDIRARRIFIEETVAGAGLRAWTVRDASGVALRTLAPPNGYDPDGWIEEEYGAPPSWLAGDALAEWFDARDPARVVPSARFVEATVLSALSDEFAALGTPEAPAAAPLPPADTNAPAFASFALSDGDVPFGWLWSPWPERTHAVFRKSDLREPRWAPVLGLVPTGPYSIWTDALPPPAAPLLRSLPSATDGSVGFYAAAEAETDTDGDGIPDGMERLAHGSSPYLADTDGDGLPDAAEIGRYGTDPARADTNGDGIPDGTAAARGLDPAGDDFDGDGLSDADEILLHGTDPRAADTDGDGLSDADEILVHGTSPFVSDTDGDGLSDRKEVEESGSSPLLRDTDGDGIDDHSEWLSYGLDPAEPADGALDGDGDGFSNADEFAWGWSLVAPASSNATPRTRLLVCQAGEEPVFKATTYDAVLVLGRDAGHGTRIRIPKSVQTGANSIGRSLHWTAAPGLHLGDASLSSAGSLQIPDQDTEFVAWASPSDGGAESTLRLLDALGRTNGTLRLRVPALSGARLYLSSVLGAQTFHTNLVAGVPGLVCIPADDPLYGRPRAWLDPQCSPDSATGHRALEQSGHLLARVSGATPGLMLHLDARRQDGAWGSSSGPRRGFALEPGLSRIEVGIDFSLDGVLDADEVAVACDVCVVPVRLTADTDRDGAVTPADRDGRDRWTPSRGALLSPDHSNAAARPFRSISSSTLAKIRIQKPGIPLPPGTRYMLTSANSSQLRLFQSGITNETSFANGSIPLDVDGTEENDATAFLAMGNLTSFDTNATPTTISLQLRCGNRTMGIDSISVRPPPIIIPWNTLPLKRLYVSELPGDAGWQFPSDVTPGLQFKIPDPDNQWVQDRMQMAGFQTDDWRGWHPLLLDLSASSANDVDDGIPAAYGHSLWNTLCRLPLPNGCNGGNVEATPPLPGYPYGRLLTFVPSNSEPCNAIRFLERQGIQGPAIRLPGGWLDVGHVDEVCCFVDERTALVPSPRLAFDLIAEQVRLHHGNYTNTFVWGLDQNDFVHCMQDVVFDRVITNAQWQANLSATATTVIGEDIGLRRGDFCLCEEELFQIDNIEPFGNFQKAELSRGLSGSFASGHPRDAMIAVLSSDSVANILADGGFSVAERIESCKQALIQAIPDISFIEVPVLFTYGGNGYVAGSPNMANSIVHGNQVFVPDPGCSLFRDALSGDGFRFVGGPAFWSMYHCLEGELHCGSETERTIPSSPEWWYKTRFSCWPFGGMK